MTTTAPTFVVRTLRVDNSASLKRARTFTSSWSSCLILSSKSISILPSRTRSTLIVQSSLNSFRARPSRNITIESISTSLDRSTLSLVVTSGASASAPKSHPKLCLSVSMFAIKVNRVLLASVPPTTSICASTTPRRVPKARRARRLSALVCSKSTSRVPSKHSETTTMVPSQTTSSSTEMVSEIQWEPRSSVTSLSNSTRLSRWSMALTKTRIQHSQNILWSLSTSV